MNLPAPGGAPPTHPRAGGGQVLGAGGVLFGCLDHNKVPVRRAARVVQRRLIRR